MLLVGDLALEVLDVDLARTSALERRFDHRADRVGVDVDVVQPGSPDDEHAVAVRGEQVAVLVGLRVGDLEEELHLELELEAAAFGVRLQRRRAPSSASAGDFAGTRGGGSGVPSSVCSRHSRKSR